MVIQKKKFTINEVEKVLSSTFKMIVSDSKYFYASTVDPKFSGLTKEGEQFTIKILNEFLPLLEDCVDRELDERAKNQVLGVLKTGEETR